MPDSPIYRTDFNRLVQQLSLTFLRQKQLLPPLLAFSKPLTTLQTQLMALGETMENRMSYNSQVCSLRKMLNDKFDNSLRRITINDAVKRRHTLIYRTPEQKSKTLGTIMLNRRDAIFSGLEFVINIPIAKRSHELEIIAWVNYYKLATTTFSIKYI